MRAALLEVQELEDANVEDVNARAFQKTQTTHSLLNLKRAGVDVGASEDEAVLDMPGRATGLQDGVAEVTQLVVLLELGAQVGLEADRRLGDRGVARCLPWCSSGHSCIPHRNQCQIKAKQFANPLMLGDRGEALI